jgi:16S rRNA C967 or C1407 C5-methylase (RsmB/RsmF family)/NOL1/NOP2/fmu family ribosome biogenesis protein
MLAMGSEADESSQEKQEVLPEAFLRRMQRMLGEEYEAFLEALGEGKYQALRLNPLKRGMDGKRVSKEILDGEFPGLSRVPWAADGYYYEVGSKPGRHPYHEAGLYYIQEPSAMAPVELLDVGPGKRVLDLCAAPGGKSTQIASKLEGSGLLVCNEIHSVRGKALSENVERLGIGNACVTNETPERLTEYFPQYFDRILVDAPCSGEGMFRKNSMACEAWSQENVDLCAKRQDGILDFAAEMLCPGGRLVYSTCTFAPEENEGSVNRFLKRHEEFSLLPLSDGQRAQMGLAGCNGVPEYLEHPTAGLEETLRLWPQRVLGEGHFAAVLQKAGSSSEGFLPQSRYGTITGIGRNEIESFVEFCGENLRISSEGEILREIGAMAGVSGEVQIIRFGEKLYLVPAQMPSPKGLKVLRIGLQLGEMKKNRFEPSHALALALAPEGAVHVWNLKADSREIRSYLNGETIPGEGEKGWYLICVDGFGIGWGKLAGNQMKNHYPKGLRGKCPLNT